MQSTTSASFALPKALTIATVSLVREEMLACLAGSVGDAEFCVDAATVDAVDAAGIQLLVALRRECASRQSRLALLAPSPMLGEALGQLGLDAALAG